MSTPSSFAEDRRPAPYSIVCAAISSCLRLFELELRTRAIDRWRRAHLTRLAARSAEPRGGVVLGLCRDHRFACLLEHDEALEATSASALSTARRDPIAPPVHRSEPHG